ncbi:unnamed protein product [Mesocestoides corti]|uniref:Brf1 TBP-binding domain-containing protein n=1 Tax=Mesocestoides corti TaxID=53468 RepID=A0A0R3UMY7_MESCO|nr:unnamed protein product [Mesocestoides corti]
MHFNVITRFPAPSHQTGMPSCLPLDLAKSKGLKHLFAPDKANADADANDDDEAVTSAKKSRSSRQVLRDVLDGVVDPDILDSCVEDLELITAHSGNRLCELMQATQQARDARDAALEAAAGGTGVVVDGGNDTTASEDTKHFADTPSPSKPMICPTDESLKLPHFLSPIKPAPPTSSVNNGSDDQKDVKVSYAIDLTDIDEEELDRSTDPLDVVPQEDEDVPEMRALVSRERIEGTTNVEMCIEMFTILSSNPCMCHTRGPWLFVIRGGVPNSLRSRLSTAVHEYFLNPQEVMVKATLWISENASFLEEQRRKRAEKQRLKEELAKQPRRPRRVARKIYQRQRRMPWHAPDKRDPAGAFSDDDEATQLKPLSKKINYAALETIVGEGARSEKSTPVPEAEGHASTVDQSRAPPRAPSTERANRLLETTIQDSSVPSNLFPTSKSSPALLQQAPQEEEDTEFEVEEDEPEDNEDDEEEVDWQEGEDLW